MSWDPGRMRLLEASCRPAAALAAGLPVWVLHHTPRRPAASAGGAETADLGPHG
jgi:hypothetical protein